MDWKAVAARHCETSPAEQAFRTGGQAGLREYLLIETGTHHGHHLYRLDPNEPLGLRMREMVCPCGDYIGTEPFYYGPTTGRPVHQRCG